MPKHGARHDVLFIKGSQCNINIEVDEEVMGPRKMRVSLKN